MAAIILGGAPDANWLPLLLPLAAIFTAIVSIEYIVKFVKKRLHKDNGCSSGS